MTPKFTVRESIAFGSLISATDPVAVLAIFKEMNADVTLYTLIFGESIFNDVIAIVLYNIVSTRINYHASIAQTIFEPIGEFCVIFFGSIMIGAFSALLISFILKR